MSPKQYSVFSVSQDDKPEKIKVKIRLLIQLYLKAPDFLIAEAVAKQIAAMLIQPEYIDNIEQRCQFRRLEMHWRCLAWIGNSAIPCKNNEQRTLLKSSSLQLK